MRERPILFKGPLVQAILDGRKTVTRRIVKPQPVGGMADDRLPREYGEHGWLWTDDNEDEWHCPQGQSGDRLWVRESWRTEAEHDDTKPSDVPDTAPVYFRADGVSADDFVRGRGCGKGRPSIFMPRWASRIDLEIVDVRAERLQEITDEDAEREGVNPRGVVSSPLGSFTTETETPARLIFCSLWEDINGKRGPEGDPAAYSWERNPWVWRIAFRMVRPRGSV